MQIQLSDHFTYKKLFRFVLPSIIMMIFTSIYTVVDGFFVSRFVGKEEFAAINLIAPFFAVIGAVGFMFGPGGSALVAKVLGEGDKEKANRYFSFITYSLIAISVIISGIGIAFLRPISRLLGADDALIDHCMLYGSIMTVGMPFFMLQNMFQNFLVAAEKSKTGLLIIVCAGITNIIGDVLLVGVFKFGLVGAAVASVLGQCIGGIIPFVIFCRKNNSLLQLGKTSFEWKPLFKTITNGSSELMTNISTSIITILYNKQLYRFAGNDGIAAYGVIMYVNFVCVAIFMGYSIGSAPIISYHYGAKNTAELKNIYKKSIISMTVAGVAMAILSFILRVPLARLFVGYDQGLADITAKGFAIYSIAFIFTGINVFGSSFFTALNNGVISATVSFLRTLLFQTAAVIFLPMIISPPLDGVWFAIIVAEVSAFIVTIIFFISKRKKYNYA